MKILGIDPGTNETGWAIYDSDSHQVLNKGIMPNQEAKEHLERLVLLESYDHASIEMIASYGMPVGKEVFNTCLFIGRLQEMFDRNKVKNTLIFRKEVKLFLCNSLRAKDPNIRRAILDLFPATGGGATPEIGTMKQPGPLYGVKGHIFAALGVALTEWNKISTEAPDS